MPLTVAMVLRSGGEYTADHVGRLAAQVRRHSPSAQIVCLSDQPVPCRAIPLAHGWPGWWSKIELFRRGLFAGPVVYLDLDSDVVGPLEPLARSDFATISDFYRPAHPASGVMAWSGDAPIAVYHQFALDPAGAMAACTTAEAWGDQGFIAAVLGQDVPRLDRALVVSHKVDVLPAGSIPAGAAVVAYHGRPKPWDIA